MNTKNGELTLNDLLRPLTLAERAAILRQEATADSNKAAILLQECRTMRESGEYFHEPTWEGGLDDWARTFNAAQMYRRAARENRAKAQRMERTAQ